MPHEPVTFTWRFCWNAHPKVVQDGRLLLHLLQHTRRLVWVQRGRRHERQQLGRHVSGQNALADIGHELVVGPHLSHVALRHCILVFQAILPADQCALLQSASSDLPQADKAL